MNISTVNSYNSTVYNKAVKHKALQFAGSNDGGLLNNDNLRGVVEKLKARVDGGGRATVTRQLIDIHAKETKADAKLFWNKVAQSLFGQSIPQLSNGGGTSHSGNNARISISPEEKVVDLFISGTPLDEYEPPSELPELLNDEDVIEGVAAKIKQDSASGKDKHANALAVQYYEAEGEFKKQIQAFLNKVSQAAFGKSVSQLVSKLGFDAVFGMDEVKAQLDEKIITAVDYNINPHNYTDTGINLNWPKGVIFHGLPGTGKSFMSKRLAEELKKQSNGENWDHYTLSYNQIASKMEGEAVQALRKAFQRAKDNAPCVLFLDEFDSFCPKKGKKTEDRQATLETNEVLTQLDNASANKVLVIAACNDIDRIEKAAYRDGRFKDQIEIPPQDKRGRTELFKQLFLKKDSAKPPFSDSDYTEFASRTRGYSAAAIEDILENTYLTRLHHERKTGQKMPLTRELVFQKIKEKKPSYSAEELIPYSHID